MSDCGNCSSTGWVCENHPDKAWDHPDGCDCGAGMPCTECNPCDRDNPPRWHEGITVIWDRVNGWRH